MRLVAFNQTDKGAVMSFADATPAEVGVVMANYLGSNGYGRTKGTEIDGVWEIGTATGRALAGGFSKRRKYAVTVSGSDPVTVEVASLMSGWSGSALGAIKEKAQRNQFAAQLRTDFQANYGEGAASTLRQCPFCKSDIRRDASVCPHCQRETEPWRLYQGRWRVKRADGDYWLDEERNAWVRWDAQTDAPT